MLDRKNIPPVGSALDLNATLGNDWTLASVSSSDSPDYGINLHGLSGNPTINGGALSGARNATVRIYGGSSNITYASNIGNDTGRFATTILIYGRSGGNVTLSGKLNATGLCVNVYDNTGGTITFSGASKVLKNNGERCAP